MPQQIGWDRRMSMARILFQTCCFGNYQCRCHWTWPTTRRSQAWVILLTLPHRRCHHLPHLLLPWRSQNPIITMWTVALLALPSAAPMELVQFQSWLSNNNSGLRFVLKYIPIKNWYFSYQEKPATRGWPKSWLNSFYQGKFRAKENHERDIESETAIKGHTFQANRARWAEYNHWGIGYPKSMHDSGTDGRRRFNNEPTREGFQGENWVRIHQHRLQIINTGYNCSVGGRQGIKHNT